jgi:zinc-binding alcohol dehydrogenase/oxidoreductase
MKAIVLQGINQSLKMLDVEVPHLSPNEALIKIKASAFNRRDWWIKQGKYAGLKFPIILGSDCSGIVDAVADDADKIWIGKEVIINPSLNWGENENFQSANFQILGLPKNGTFAEFVKVNVSQLHKKPQFLSFEEAAAIPLSGLTAYRALFTKARLQKGDNVLIAGAGGGTATFAILFSVAAGANVYVTSGSNDKIDKAIKLGAKAGFCYKDVDWDKQLLKCVKGLDVIIDSALGDGFSKYPHLANPGGRIVFFGGTTGNIPELNGRPIFWKQLEILGTTMGSPKDFETMISFVNQHKIKPVIDTIFRMDDAEKAINKMNEYEQFGKIILRN